MSTAAGGPGTAAAGGAAAGAAARDGASGGHGTGDAAHGDRGSGGGGPGGRTSAWPPLNELALARGEVDRSGHLRTDEAWLAAAWANPDTRVIVVEGGRAMIGLTDGKTWLWTCPPAEAPDGVRFLLGVDEDGVAYFGVAGMLPAPPEPEVRAVSLRVAGPLLSDRDAGLLTHAVALGNWHETFTHCPRCGAPTEPFASGHARRCPVDGSEHFPRVDPAMIVLVTDSADRCLLARNSAWPVNRVSILAGFVEAGESAEQTVAREVHEETGIVVGDVCYLGSQPWPMPQSLMLGFRALVTGAAEITVDDEEIVEANWYSREDLRIAVAEGRLLLPPPVSIAHRIIESWYGAELPGTW